MSTFPLIGSALVCCDAAQVRTLVSNINNAEAIFGRCQTCVGNMLRSICAFTCGADQSRFINATVGINESFFGTAEVVLEIDINIDERFVNETYDSCQGVVNPATGTTSMDIACGFYDSRTCTPRR